MVAAALGFACAPTDAAAAVALDPDFGSAGIVHTSPVRLPLGFEDAQVAVDGRGRLLSTGAAPEATVLVARRHRDGSLDRSFGTAGVARIDLAEVAGSGGGEPDPTGLALLADRSILVSGSIDSDVGTGSGQVGFVALLRPNGSLDTGFAGTPGTGTVPGVALFDDLRIDSVAFGRGGILIGGRVGHGAAVVGRLERDGELDREFGVRGFFELADRGGKGNVSGAVTDLLTAGDGSVYAAGFERGRLFVARLGVDGSLDRRFGKGGVETVDAARHRGCGCTYGTGLALDRRGRILVSGFVSSLGPPPRRVGARERFVPEGDRAILLRLLPDGDVDQSFDGGVVSPRVGGDSRGNAVAVDGHGDAVLVGSASPAGRGGNGARSRIMVARVFADGEPDPSFGRHGVFDRPLAAGEVIGSDVLTAPGGATTVIATASKPAAGIRSSLLVRFLATRRLGRPAFSGRRGFVGRP